MAFSSGVQSRSSTIRRNRPAESRRMRPKPVGSGTHGRAQQAGRPVVLLAREQVGQRLGPEQRLVADQDHARAPIIGQERPADLDGVAGAELLGSGWRRGRRARPRRHSRTWSAA